MMEKQNVEAAKIILESIIDANLAFCTNASDLISTSNTTDLPDKLTNIVLKVASQDTLILITLLAILQTKKVRKKHG